MRLGVDPKHADQMVRGTVVLPHGLGKTARVLVFAGRREDPRGRRGGRRPRRRRGARQEDRRRLAGLRRGGGDPGHDAGRRPPRQGPRSPRPDAEPEGGHRDAGRRQGGPGDQGRQGGVPRRQDRDHPCADRQAVLRDRQAEGERRRPDRRGDQGQAERGQGQVRQGRERVVHDGPRHQGGRGRRHRGAPRPKETGAWLADAPTKSNCSPNTRGPGRRRTRS